MVNTAASTVAAQIFDVAVSHLPATGSSTTGERSRKPVAETPLVDELRLTMVWTLRHRTAAGEDHGEKRPGAPGRWRRRIAAGCRRKPSCTGAALTIDEDCRADGVVRNGQSRLRYAVARLRAN